MNPDSESFTELEQLLERVRYVPKHVEHHGQHSGYDALFAACGMRQARSNLFVRIANWIPEAFAWRLRRLRAQPSSQSGLEAELAAAPWVATGRDRVCHFVYGEDTFLFTPLWRKSGNPCVATVHYPPALLSQRVNPGSLKSLDAIIIVGENQREWLSGIVDPATIHFCPHHVDSEFFCPSDSAMLGNCGFSLLCVGHMFRDYDVLLETFRLLRTQYGRDVSLDLVGPRLDSTHALVVEPGVNVHRNISDESLRDLYRTATVGVMPLTDATANNSLLEMMACGLPIVVTDVGGVRDYVQSGGVIMQPPGDSDGFARAVDGLLGDPTMRSKNGTANRAHAVCEFSIPACARKLATIYKSLLA